MSKGVKQELTETYGKALSKARAYSEKLSQREKLYGVITAVLLGLVICYQFTEFVLAQFATQREDITQTERDMKTVALLADRYNRAQLRKEAIEKEYKQIEFKGGALSYIEGLVKEKTGLAPAQFEIDDQPPTPFGQNHEQVPFIVKFSIDNIGKLVAFMEAVTRGPNRLILSQLEIKKAGQTDKLNVRLSLTSIRLIK